MNITINGKGMKVGEQLRRRIENKLSKFNRFFGDEAEAFVKVKSEKDQKRIEVTLKIHKHFYRAECVADDAFTAMDEAIDVLEGQIRKHKTKIEKKIHDYAYMQEYLKTQVPEAEEAEDDYRIIRHKTFQIEPMDAEEAVLQMEMLGHNFLVYLDGESGRVCVVYKRKDGHYGLIEPIY